MNQANSILPKATQIRAFRVHPDVIVHLGHIISKYSLACMKGSVIATRDFSTPNRKLIQISLA